MNRLLVKIGRSYFFVNITDIDWIESDRNYLRIHLGEKSYLIRNTMIEMEKKLDPNQFVRINRSIMVNIEQIKELRAQNNSSYQVILYNNLVWTWSRRFRANLHRILKPS